MSEETTKKKVTIMPFTKARRVEWKKKAKHALKTHYILLILVALIGGLLGAEAGYNLDKDDLNVQNIQVTDVAKARAATGLSDITGINWQSESDERYSQVIESVMTGDLKSAIDKATQNVEVEKNKTKNKNVVAGRTNGIFASIANEISSGSVVVIVATGLSSITKNGKLAGGLAILLVLAVYFLFWFFLVNPYSVMMNRVYLEARTYEKVPISHVLFLTTVKKWRPVSGAMFRRWLYHTLWCLTIVGGFIKYYSYWCVPYILAENPSLTGREAIKMSREMMNGRKWELFKYDLTFIGWDILAVVTFGIARVFFVTPYKRCTDAELFSYIREESKKDKISGTEKLKDMFLYEKTDPEVLEIKYGDILYREKLAKAAEVKLKGVKRFCVENFGLWLGSTKDQKRYEEVEIEQVNLERARDAAQAKIYPERYNPLWNDVAEGNYSSKNNYLKSYSIWSLIAIFAIIAFVGWGWEVTIHLIKDGVFINRGALHGPWLPIYGGGVVLILLLLKKLRKNPGLLAISIVVLCGILEYFTSYFMEVSKGIRWWDYTGYFLNINGRICAEGLTVFAVGGMAAVYLLAPVIDSWLQKLKPQILIALCIVFAVVFCADLVYSQTHPNVGKGITDYKNFQNVEKEPADAAGAGGTSVIEVVDYEVHIS